VPFIGGYWFHLSALAASVAAKSGGGWCCGSPSDIRIGGSLTRGVTGFNSVRNASNG